MIINKNGWNKYVENNKDPYGAFCIKTAKKIMDILDKKYENKKPINPKDTHILICKNGKGITGFMAGCVSAMISQVHSMGKEWQKAWNIDNQINNEGEEATKRNKILNPALLTIQTKE